MNVRPQLRVHSNRALRIASVGLAACGLALTSAAAPAHAVTEEPEPVVTPSYYVDQSSTGTMKDLGCSQGLADSIDEADTAVILDFGGQLKGGTGTELPGGADGSLTNAQIETLAEDFGEAYYECIDSESEGSVRIIIGTNNSKEDVSKAGGKAWAGVVKAAANEVLASPGEAGRVAIWGGDDLEVGYSNASAARSWAKGYSANTESPYVDFGDAAGCSTTTHTNSKCESPGTKGWNQKVEYEVSWEIKGANPSPEIYYNPPPGAPSNAEQWAQIDLYGAGRMHFIGVLDQGEAEESNSPQQAYEQLHGQLLAHELFSEIPFALSISFEPFADDVLGAPEHTGAGTPSITTSRSARAFANCMAPFTGYPPEKLAPLEEECRQRAAAIANLTVAEEEAVKVALRDSAPVRQTLSEAAEATSGPPARVTGLNDSREGPPGRSQAFDSTGSWGGEVDGRWYQVYAGAKMTPGANVPDGSELLVYEDPTNIQTGRRALLLGEYAPPGGGSEPLELVSASGGTLTVQTSGSTLSFDLTTRSFSSG
jgi:hypothetical protein